MAFKRNLIQKWTKVQNNKKSYKEKAAETRAHSARLSDMQTYVDLSKEKRAELIKVLNSKATDCDMLIREKGALVFTRLLEVAEVLKKDIEDAGITCYMITSKQPQKQRSSIVEMFKKDSSNTVVVISEAGGESVSMQTTNEIIMYNVPRGPGKWTQVLGRIARLFSKYEDVGFNVHFVTVLDSIDEYSQILLSAKRELEEEILSADTIPLKEESSFNQQVVKKIRQHVLWKAGKRKKSPKISK